MDGILKVTLNAGVVSNDRARFSHLTATTAYIPLEGLMAPLEAIIKSANLHIITCAIRLTVHNKNKK